MEEIRPRRWPLRSVSDATPTTPTGFFNYLKLQITTNGNTHCLRSPPHAFLPHRLLDRDTPFIFGSGVLWRGIRPQPHPRHLFHPVLPLRTWRRLGDTS